MVAPPLTMSIWISRRTRWRCGKAQICLKLCVGLGEGEERGREAKRFHLRMMAHGWSRSMPCRMLRLLRRDDLFWMVSHNFKEKKVRKWRTLRRCSAINIRVARFVVMHQHNVRCISYHIDMCHIRFGSTLTELQSFKHEQKKGALLSTLCTVGPLDLNCKLECEDLTMDFTSTVCLFC